MQGTVITNKGLQLIAKLVASGTALSFTRAAVGIGSVPSGYDPTNMTGLNKYKMDGSIASCGSSGDTASIVFQISSIGVSTGFTITEAGLFATDPDEGEILYCYLDMSSDPQYIYAEGSAISKFVEMTLTVVIGSVQSVTAYINPGSLLTNDGDISNTKVSSFTPTTASYPVPAANDTVKAGFGKIKKFFEDIRNATTGACFIGSIVNNCVTNNAKLPLSAAQGKVLMDLYAELNSDLAKKHISPTFKTGYSAEGNRGYITISGKTVTLNLGVYSDVGYGAGEVVATIPTEYAPSLAFATGCYIGSALDKIESVGYAYINTAGDILIADSNFTKRKIARLVVTYQIA